MAAPPRAPLPELDEVRRRICERLRRQTGRHAGDHLSRLPRRYLVDHDDGDMAEDVLLHWRILDECANDPDKRPVFHGRFLKSLTVDADHDAISRDDQELRHPTCRGESKIFLHEIILSSVDRVKLLSRATELLSDVGLNIRSAHIYFTTDGFCLFIVVVDGWETEDAQELIDAIKETLALKNDRQWI